ncbi:MAG: wax ester/triacylglycerol synthase domain-containing protein, partial [Thermoleophilia bacterium]
MTRELLSPEDARILALESGTIRGHTCKVIVIDGERSAEDFRGQLRKRLGAVPSMQRRLDPTADPPAWVDDPGFSLDHHVLDRGALDDAGLRRLVATAMETRLDREHPLWAMDVVSRLPGGRSAVVWRIHHALSDGMTSMRMARALLLDPVEEEAHGQRPSRPPPSVHQRRT